jgi:rhodanese-related sulfurtransferase
MKHSEDFLRLAAAPTKMGYRNVVSIEGGLAAWQATGKAVSRLP